MCSGVKHPNLDEQTKMKLNETELDGQKRAKLKNARNEDIGAERQWDGYRDVQLTYCVLFQLLLSLWRQRLRLIQKNLLSNFVWDEVTENCKFSHAAENHPAANKAEMEGTIKPALISSPPRPTTHHPSLSSSFLSHQLVIFTPYLFPFFFFFFSFSLFPPPLPPSPPIHSCCRGNNT